MAALSSPLPESPDLARYLIHSRSEIFALLREIQRGHVLLTVYFDGGSRFILTSLLQVSLDNEVLILDCGKDAAVTRALTRSVRPSVVAFLNNVKIQFSARNITMTTFEGAPALAMPLPDTLLRYQRRESYRTMTYGRTVTCQLPSPAGDVTTVNARILDIGCGGVSLLVGQNQPCYERNILLSGCSIELPRIGTVAVTLEIREISVVATPSGVKQFRYGCAFRDIPGSAAAMIQRFVNQLQRERMTLA